MEVGDPGDPSTALLCNAEEEPQLVPLSLTLSFDSLMLAYHC